MGHFTRAMRRHDLTNQKTMTKTKTMTQRGAKAGALGGRGFKPPPASLIHQTQATGSLFAFFLLPVCEIIKLPIKATDPPAE